MNNIIEKVQAKKPVKLFLQFGEHIEDCALSIHSGHTAFFFMLSFFPFMLFLFAILRITPLTEEFFSDFLPNIIPLSFHDFIGNLIHDIYAASNGQLLSFSIISAVWLSAKSPHLVIHNVPAKRIQKFHYAANFCIYLQHTLCPTINCHTWTFGIWQLDLHAYYPELSVCCLYHKKYYKFQNVNRFFCTFYYISSYVLRFTEL